jgi:GTP cyclohydrolase I
MNKKQKPLTFDFTQLEEPVAGLANGVSTQLADLLSKGEIRSLNQSEKEAIIEEAASHYGNFLTALGVNWQEDPNSENTPKRVAKAYVNDLWKGRYDLISEITTFPSNYDGMIVETNIPVFSQCAHHHQQILGTCHLGYIPGDSKQVMGLSKLNRIVEHFSRRGQIQEDLTMQIFNTLNTVIPDNLGVAVVVDSKHSCVSCRGVKHQGASMQTAKLSGAFLQEPECREEFYMYVRNAVSKC